jgi:hypothetical protein
MASRLADAGKDEKPRKSRLADAVRLAQAVVSPVSAMGSELIRAARNEFSGAEARDRGAQMPIANWPDGPGLAVPQAVYDLIDSGRQFNNAAEASRGIPHTAEQSWPRDKDAALAGAVMTGGLGAIRPTGSLGMFGGRLAKTADHAALAKAEELAAKGAPREQIWNETGWFQGADNKWRFEIDDSGAKPSWWRSTGRLGKVLKHPELKNAYPDVAAIPVKRMKDTAGLSMGAGYQERGKGLLGSWRQPEEISFSPFSELLDPEGQPTRLLHEAQHAIQKREGFARGANQSEYSYLVDGDTGPNSVAGPRFRHAREAVAPYADEMMRRDGLSPTEPALDFANIPKERIVAAIDENLAWKKQRQEYERKAYDALNKGAYDRSAGEVEARNVEARQHMTAEERRATPPWQTQDRPFDRQLLQGWGELSPIPGQKPLTPTEVLPPAPLANTYTAGVPKVIEGEAETISWSPAVMDILARYGLDATTLGGR